VRALAQPGDPVILESPTYPGTIAAAYAAALRPVPVPLDGEGMRPDYLDEALTRTRARVIVVQPLFQNPTGASLSATRQDEIRAISRRHGAFVVEDDFARHLTHADAVPVPPPMIADTRMAGSCTSSIPCSFPRRYSSRRWRWWPPPDGGVL
jgi:DNA-binding transcriptional MocR family regulator